MSEQLMNTVNWLWRSLPALPQPKEVERVVVHEVKEMLPRSGSFFVRVAGLSGGLAVILGAYGAHAFLNKDVDTKLKITYETGNRYHFIHSLALLAVPLTRRPYIVGPLLTTGMVLFSGSCYYHALTENQAIRQVTPYGGMLLIAGWAAMIL